MFANHPEIAKRWAAEYPNLGKLPARVGVGNTRERIVDALMARRRA